MKLTWLVLLAVGVLAIVCQAADKTFYQTGKLIDLRRERTGSGAARAQGSFCLAVAVGDTAYLVRHEAYWRWSYEPTDFVVGDSIDVKIKGNTMYLRKGDGGEIKSSIVRRERIAEGKEAPNCGVAVTSN